MCRFTFTLLFIVMRVLDNYTCAKDIPYRNLVFLPSRSTNYWPLYAGMVHTPIGQAFKSQSMAWDLCRLHIDTLLECRLFIGVCMRTCVRVCVCVCVLGLL